MNDALSEEKRWMDGFLDGGSIWFAEQYMVISGFLMALSIRDGSQKSANGVEKKKCFKGSFKCHEVMKWTKQKPLLYREGAEKG